MARHDSAVVGYAHELDRNSGGQVENGNARAPVAVLGLPNRPDVQEQHVVDRLNVRFVRMAEDNDVGVRARGDSSQTASDRSSNRYSFIVAGTAMNEEHTFAIRFETPLAVEPSEHGPILDRDVCLGP